MNCSRDVTYVGNMNRPCLGANTAVKAGAWSLAQVSTFSSWCSLPRAEVTTACRPAPEPSSRNSDPRSASANSATSSSASASVIGCGQGQLQLRVRVQVGSQRVLG